MKITIGGDEKVLSNAIKKSRLVSKVHTKTRKEMKALINSNIVETMTHAELVEALKEAYWGLTLLLYEAKREGKLD